MSVEPVETITLFKFRGINKNLIDTLIKGIIYCTRPALLNDPFDCQVDIKKAAEKAIDLLSGKKRQNLMRLSKLKYFFDDIQSAIRRAGICSFSLNMEEPLLWSHYADGHKGLCLTYDIPFHLFFELSKQIEGAILPVDYGENPLTDWFIENTPETAKIDSQEFSNSLVKKCLSIKGPGWAYEKEARIICNKEGALQIPKIFLKQVCFGMNAAESDISLIKQITESNGYSVEYYQIKRGEQDFGTKKVRI